VEVKLSEAKDPKWFDAIEKKNCKILLQLFRSDRSLWVQTGLKGRSVLHVAVMLGCSELVRELHYYEGDLVPRGKNWQTPFEFLWENARDGRLKNASAQDLWLIMEGPFDEWFPRHGRRVTDWMEYRRVNDGIKRHMKGESRVEGEDREVLMRESVFGRSRDEYIRSHVDSEDHGYDQEDLENLRAAINSIANKEQFVMDKNDVDFNFENAERKELYVHMACSRLRNVHNREEWDRYGCEQIVKFIIAVLTDLRHKYLLPRLFEQKDGQGRTILQVLMTPTPNGKTPKPNFVKDVFKLMLQILPKECLNALDNGGRTILHWAVAHITWAVTALLSSEEVEFLTLFPFDTQYIENITPFHLILLYDLNLPLSYCPFLKSELRNDCGIQSIFNHNVMAPNCDLSCKTLNPLACAIRMGRNKFVKDIMKALVICPHLYTSLTLMLVCSIV